MPAHVPAREFRIELVDWTLRGVLLAATSAFWAVLTRFTSAGELAGMGTGVGIWILAFAALSAHLRGNEGDAARHTGPRVSVADALAWAAWIKLGLTAAAWVLYLAAGLAGLQNLLQVALLGMTDTLLGLAVLSVIGLLAGVGAPGVPGLDSFGWTFLATMLEGGLMAFVVGGIALLLVAFQRVRAAFRPALTLSPVS